MYMQEEEPEEEYVDAGAIAHDDDFAPGSDSDFSDPGMGRGPARKKARTGTARGRGSRARGSAAAAAAAAAGAAGDGDADGKLIAGPKDMLVQQKPASRGSGPPLKNRKQVVRAKPGAAKKRAAKPSTAKSRLAAKLGLKFKKR